jgi:hypothetical protein
MLEINLITVIYKRIGGLTPKEQQNLLLYPFIGLIFIP